MQMCTLLRSCVTCKVQSHIDVADAAKITENVFSDTTAACFRVKTLFNVPSIMFFKLVCWFSNYFTDEAKKEESVLLSIEA